MSPLREMPQAVLAPDGLVGLEVQMREEVGGGEGSSRNSSSRG